MTIAARKQQFEQIEALVATGGVPTLTPTLTRLYDAAIRGMSQPELLSSEEIQKICYVFAARCFAADVPLPA